MALGVDHAYVTITSARSCVAQVVGHYINELTSLSPVDVQVVCVTDVRVNATNFVFLMVLIFSTSSTLRLPLPRQLARTYAGFVCERSQNSALSEPASHFRIQFKSFSLLTIVSKSSWAERWAFTKVLARRTLRAQLSTVWWCFYGIWSDSHWSAGRGDF